MSNKPDQRVESNPIVQSKCWKCHWQKDSDGTDIHPKRCPNCGGALDHSRKLGQSSVWPTKPHEDR